MKTAPELGKHDILPCEHRIWDFKSFELAIQRTKQGWFIKILDDKEASQDKIPDFSTAEYYQTGNSNTLLLVPSFPPKPLVFKGSQLHLAPRQELSFFLKIPLFINIYYLRKKPENLLREIPVQNLSNTWFGETDNGEPAFLLGGDYYLSPAETEFHSYEALCPVTINNNWTGVLQIERMIILVDNLMIYENNGKNITSVVSLEYKGKDVTSSAEYHYSKALHGEKAKMIAKARNSSKTRLKMNFHFLKNR